MANTYPLSRPIGFLHFFNSALLCFPVACFSLTVLTDIAYWRTSNLLWLHFSEWLLLAGLVFGAIALLVLLVNWLITRARPPWMATLCGIVVLLLATINSFVHTADGWTAVVPWGLAFSLLTVVAMLVTAWFGREGVRHV
ncbi:DUF2231 domain-containing protein [Mesorhizobium sp. VNQ89]|uniref:DUF2231 domain-containing protein n=1 Tax=Mesorhizobium quangtriensis TaxID=3157709 RepID=UPI0032B836A1